MLGNVLKKGKSDFDSALNCVDQNISQQLFLDKKALFYLHLADKTPISRQASSHRQGAVELRLFPRCDVYSTLSCSSWALFIKLLKITNYPSLAVCRTVPKPQRTPVVLTMTKKLESQILNIAYLLSFIVISLTRPVWLSVYLSFYLSVCPSASIHLCACLSVLASN